MVERDGSYFWGPFKGQCGVTQGDPLSPKIFNVLVDAALWHWVTVVKSTEETSDPSTYGFRRDIQRLAAHLHADDGLLDLTRAHRLQRAFDILAELFDQVGLRTNVGNM